MNTNRLRGKSRYLTFLLRHHPEQENLSIDDNGWVEVKEVISKLHITEPELQWIVDNDNKTRFAYNENKTKIRANQGHSIDVELNYSLKTPPIILYHGTSEKNLKSIFETGLVKMTRHHVHLSSSYETAFQVGSRHGSPIVLEIDCKHMHDNNYQFYQSENGIWLTDHVPPNYLRLMRKSSSQN